MAEAKERGVVAENLGVLAERPASMARMFLDRVAETPDREAFQHPVGDGWGSLTWRQTGEQVQRWAAGLLALGISPQERVAIIANTRVEWIIADLAVMCAGAATTTVYPTTPEDDVAYILSDSGSRVAFAEDDEQIAKLRAHRDRLPGLEKVVTFDGTPDGDWVIAVTELEALGRQHLDGEPDAVEKVVAGIEPDHLATLIYTSGTTGRPKGVRLTHDCWTYEGKAIQALDLLVADDLQYLWLPLSHSFGKVLTAGQLAIGFTSAVDGRIPKLVDNLAVVRPTFMAGAPRIFEKVHSRVVSGVEEEGGLKKKIFDWAFGVGRKVSRLRQQGREPSGVLAAQHAIATKLVFSKLHARFGGRLKYFVSGSAALSKDIAEFFHAADILILEGYGLTETSAASFVNRPHHYRFGTVGHPLPGTEVRIADDGEILLRGPGVMRGYHGLDDETRAAFTDDGWFRTGDIGELDDEGFLRITDRKKDLIKTSGGKYVAPQGIEVQWAAVCPLSGQLVVHGDGRKYCTALIAFDEESVDAWAQQHGVAGSSYADVVAGPDFRAQVDGWMAELNGRLPRWETVKRWTVLPRPL
ncbi:AMP-dependent synthetase/ligase, partial [Oryzihumus sp.]